MRLQIKIRRNKEHKSTHETATAGAGEEVAAGPGALTGTLRQ
mgnify:CR=1 FL=1